MNTWTGLIVDDPNGVIEVGKPTKLTCKYMKGRRETVHTVRWYLSYQNKDYGNVSIDYLFINFGLDFLSS